jgi:hypothetical protein
VLPVFLISIPVAAIDGLVAFAGTDDTFVGGLQCNLPSDYEEGWFADGMRLFPNYRSCHFHKSERIAAEP